jgi:hypothetical protein
MLEAESVEENSEVSKIPILRDSILKVDVMLVRREKIYGREDEVQGRTGSSFLARRTPETSMFAPAY